MQNARMAGLAMLTVATALSSLPAAAVNRDASLIATAANVCVPALPAYEGLVRKRPLAVQNEGSAAAFITCSLAAGGIVKSVMLYASSFDGQAHDITCTAVVIGDSPNYVTKTITLVAGGGLGIVYITPSDIGSTSGNLNTRTVSFSCVAAPGSGINGTYLNWDQDVGL